MKTKAEFYARGFADFDAVMRCNNTHAKERHAYYHARQAETQSWQSVAYVTGYRAAMLAFDQAASAQYETETRVVETVVCNAHRAQIQANGTVQVSEAFETDENGATLWAWSAMECFESVEAARDWIKAELCPDGASIVTTVTDGPITWKMPRADNEGRRAAFDALCSIDDDHKE